MTAPRSHSAVPAKYDISLSVFFPAYNDAPSLPGLIEKTFEVLREQMEDYVEKPAVDSVDTLIRRCIRNRHISVGIVNDQKSKSAKSHDTVKMCTRRRKDTCCGDGHSVVRLYIDE